MNRFIHRIMLQKLLKWKVFHSMQRKSFGWFAYAHSLDNQTSANYRNIQMNWWAPKRKPRSSEKPFFLRWLINHFHKSKLTSAHWTWFLDTEHWTPNTIYFNNKFIFLWSSNWTQFSHLHFICIICFLFLPLWSRMFNHYYLTMVTINKMRSFNAIKFN